MPGTQIAAGNFLLAFAVLVSGGSVTKVLTVFRHMGLSCITLRTFFRYQHVSEFASSTNPVGDINFESGPAR